MLTVHQSLLLVLRVLCMVLPPLQLVLEMCNLLLELCQLAALGGLRSTQGLKAWLDPPGGHSGVAAHKTGIG